MSAADPPYSGQRHPGHPQVTQADIDAAVKAERERIRLALLGCVRCGKIHEFRRPEPCEHHPDRCSGLPTWADPYDGHAYATRWRDLLPDPADLTALIYGGAP